MRHRAVNSDSCRDASRQRAPVGYGQGSGTEKAVAGLCDDFAAQLGWTVDRFEQTRATRICIGLPDRRYHGPNGWRIWVELKRPGGKLTEAQYRWLLAELDAGALAIVVDDVAVLAEVRRRWRQLYGQADALAYCRQVLELTKQRGWR